MSIINHQFDTGLWLGGPKAKKRQPKFAIRTTDDVWQSFGFKDYVYYAISKDNRHVILSPKQQSFYYPQRKLISTKGSIYTYLPISIASANGYDTTIPCSPIEATIDNEVKYKVQIPIPEGIKLRGPRITIPNSEVEDEDEDESEEEDESETEFNYGMGRSGARHKQTQTQKLMTPSEWWEAVQTVVIGIEQDVGNVDILLDVLVKMKIK